MLQTFAAAKQRPRPSGHLSFHYWPELAIPKGNKKFFAPGPAFRGYWERKTNPSNPFWQDIALISRVLKTGFLNISEQALVRIGDALFSLGLVLSFAPEQFAKLALAQALVAPLLVLFISPDSILYREFSLWRERGFGFIGANLRAFRLMGWLKAAMALAISALCALRGEDYLSTFCSMTWAFSLVLMPQVAGPDREFLRLNLALKPLNLLTFAQKALMLIGLYAIVTYFHRSIPALAALSAAVLVLNFLFTKICVNRLLVSQGAKPNEIRGQEGPSPRSVIAHSLKNYSFWNHLSGISQLWIQTMDLFFLGALRLPAGPVGLYAFVLKISNMVLLVPTAIASNVLIWLGRRAHTAEGMEEEWQRQKKFTLALGAFVACILFAASVAAPTLLTLLSRGRWNAVDQAEMISWMRWILAGTFFYAMALPLAMWLQVRASSFDLFRRVYGPWLAIAAIAYYFGAKRDGLIGVAKMNVAVGLAYGILISLFLWKLRRSGPNGLSPTPAAV